MQFAVRNILRLCTILLVVCAPVFAQADALQDALKRGSLKIGVANFAPWTLKNEQGQLAGFEIDVGEKLAADMGLKADFKVYDWEKIVPALQKGEIDLIAAGMAITPSRALQVNFSQPYSESGVGLATNTKLTRKIKTFRQLNNKDVIVATVIDTLAADLTHTVFTEATIREYTTGKEAEQALLEGKVFAYVASLPEVQFLALSQPKVVDLPLSKPLLESKAGFATKKGEQELLNFLNAWIVSRKADKWIGTTHKYWFDSIQWRKEAQ